MAHISPKWVTFGNIVDRWIGANAPTDENLVNALIIDAEHVVLSAYPAIQDRIDDGRLELGMVQLVVARMVIRVLRNPENLTYLQQTTGPFGAAKNFGATAQDIWMSAEEKGMLAPNKAGKAFSVDLGADAGIVAIGRLTERELTAFELDGLPQDSDNDD